MDMYSTCEEEKWFVVKDPIEKESGSADLSRAGLADDVTKLTAWWAEASWTRQDKMLAGRTEESFERLTAAVAEGNFSLNRGKTENMFHFAGRG